MLRLIVGPIQYVTIHINNQIFLFNNKIALGFVQVYMITVSTKHICDLIDLFIFKKKMSKI